MMAGQTDGPEDIEALIQFCRNKRSMQAIEVLPYHLLGVQVRLGARVEGGRGRPLLCARGLQPAAASASACCSCADCAAAVCCCSGHSRLVVLLPSLLPAEVGGGWPQVPADGHELAHGGAGALLHMGPEQRRRCARRLGPASYYAAVRRCLAWSPLYCT